MKTSKKRCWFVCSYFNPCNYYSRFLNFIEFINSIKEQNINLLVVEAYSVKSKYRIDFSQKYLSLKFYKKIVLLEKLLFKGSRHCKRGQGIQMLPSWITFQVRELALIDDICDILQRITT